MRGVFYAGRAEGPKDIKESVTQASVAAVRAILLMHKGETTTEPIAFEIIEENCKSCGKCVQVCPYDTITVEVKSKRPWLILQPAQGVVHVVPSVILMLRVFY